jgi:hypothetical protein
MPSAAAPPWVKLAAVSPSKDREIMELRRRLEDKEI